MIATLATIRVNEGQGAEFEKTFKELTEKVRANEPGCTLYQLAKSRTEPNTYKVFEIYKDAAAVEAHRASDHFRTLGRAMGAHMAGRPEIEQLDLVL